MDTLRTLQTLCDGLSGHRERTALLALRADRPAAAWTFARLDRSSRRFAAGLLAAGVSPGEPVALLASERPEWIVACLAVVRAGAVVCPLDLQLGDESLRHILDDSQARVVITTAGELERVRRVSPGSRRRVVLLDAPRDERHWRRLLPDAATARRQTLPSVGPDDPAALFYTSGTTGPPKGVPLTHGNLASQLNALIDLDPLEHDDHVLLPLPLHHVYPFVIGVLVPLLFGMTIVLPQALTGPELVRALKEGHVTVIVGVPRLYRALLDGVEAQATSRGRLAALAFRAALGGSTLLRRRLGLRLGKKLLRPLHERLGPDVRVAVSGGAALEPALAWRLEGLGWQLGTGYGLTETAPMLTLDQPGAARLGSVGRSLPGVQIRIAAPPEDETEDVDDSDDGPAPAKDGGNSGEIQARGPNVFAGYRGLPDKTAEAFTEDGWFRTGDLGHFDADGWLYVDGRATEQIKTESGEKVQPEELERVFKDSPALREVAVLQVERRLVALAVPASQAQAGGDLRRAVEQAIRERSRELPSYARISAVALTREPLPRTRLGKLRRHLLPERYAQAQQGKERPQRAARPLEVAELPADDRTLLESPAARATWDLLAEHYAKVALTPDSSLQLDLEVDSLEWLNLTIAIGQRAGVELDEASLARLETVRDLLRAVAQATPGHRKPQASPLEHPERSLSPEQKRWLRPPGWLRRAVARAAWVLNRAFARLLFRVRAEGLENLPAKGALVLAPNHASHLDAFVIAALLDAERLRRTSWAAWTGVAFTNAFVRMLSRIGQVVPVDPERGAMSSLAFAAVVLERERTLVWFPEGQRSPDGTLQPFKAGLGLILERVPATVVPVRIEGTYDALPRGRWLPRPRRVTVTFGRPLDPRELERRGHGESAAERIVQALRRHVVAMGRRSSSAPRRSARRPASSARRPASSARRPALRPPPGHRHA